MDPEAILDIANQVVRLKMFPYFTAAHFILCALRVREDLGIGYQQFSRKHPFACWVTYIVAAFAGGMCANALLGESTLTPLRYTSKLTLATIVWYIIFYTPLDIGYKVTTFLPIKIVCSAMKEIYRCRTVYDGVSHVAKLYPNAYLIMIIIGTVKGNGASLTRIFERLIRGVFAPTSLEFMHPSFTTKSCVIASVIFILDKKTNLISIPHALVYFGVILFFVYSKLSFILLGIHDPVIPFENFICTIFFGGLWDPTAKKVN